MTNTTTTDVQLRGHCQRCARQQAVARFGMAHHGYTVEDGFFNGKCRGHEFAPIEQDRTEADNMVRMVRADVARLLATVARLESGESHPAEVKAGTELRDTPKGKRWVDRMVPWADGTDYQRGEALRSAIWQTKSRAEAGTKWADQMEALCDRVHGQPLVQVQRAEAPEAIPAGDKRTHKSNPALVLTCKYVERGMVHYTYTRPSGQTFATKMATRSWRMLTKAE